MSPIPSDVTPDMWVWCDCDFGNRSNPTADHTRMPGYLRELADRVERGEIVHVNIAMHLKPDQQAVKNWRYSGVQ